MWQQNNIQNILAENVLRGFCSVLYLANVDTGNGLVQVMALSDKKPLPGVGVTKPTPLCYFPNFSSLWKHMLTIKYHINIWQVLPQQGCGDTCQIWMWFKII